MGLKLDPKVQPFLRTLAPGPKRAIREVLAALNADSHARPPGVDVKALDLDLDMARHYRIRVGDYRIVFRIEGPDVYVVRAFHRSDGYGWLERL